MALIHINANTFEQAVEKSPMLIVDFWASWCGPCLRFAPTFESVSQDNDDVTFAKFQTDASPENQAFFESSGMRAVPTLLLFKEGNLLSAIPGALRRSDLNEVIGNLRDFDLSQIPQQADDEADADSEAPAAA
ncbi:MAG: thioredoxin family protein [Propionibacteriaceae bacterium]|jgi:thioredoxin 1|nr:thioredoxin family protein [Propionibacteriaceae bacterium]